MRYARIDYSGAESRQSGLKGLRAYEAYQKNTATEIRTTVG